MIITIIPIITVFISTSFFTYNAILEDLQKRIINNNMKTLDTIKNEIEVRIENFEKESINLLLDKTLQSYIDFTGPSEEESFLKRSCHSNFFHNTPKVEYMARNICIIKSPENYIYIDSNEKLKSEYVKEFVLNISNKNPNIYTQKYYNPDNQFLGAFGVLHYVHPAPRLTGYKTDAFVVINLSPSFIANILSQFYYKGSIFYVMDYNGNMVYQIPDKPLEEIVYKKTNSAGYYISNTSMGDMLTSHINIDKLGWILSIQLPLNTIFKQLNRYRRIFIYSNLLAILASLILFYFTINTITRRIDEVSTVMDKVKKGDLSSRFYVRYKDEISVIGSRLNEMIESIQFLRFDISRREMRQREAELIALQSQINPHFLYNTLETVKMVAIINDDILTSDIIQKLADLFRYTIGKGGRENIVYIKDEIKHVKMYLDIQQMRFEDCFEVEIIVDNSIMKYKIIKLVLQPVVENIFLHGFKTEFNAIERKGIIKITGMLEEDQIKFIIEDNGVGFKKARLNEIRNMLSRSPFELRASRTIGLTNVSDRIKLYYGQNYGVEIFSKYNVGTKVIITLPLLKEEHNSA
jgi:sensor histidine kinase YesM